MRKGSKKLVCSSCGKKVGYKVPTGRSHHGIEEVEFQMDLGCTWTVELGHQKYYCKECKPSHLN